MIIAGAYNVTVQEGDTGTIQFEFPIEFSLADFDAKIQVREKYNSPVIAEFSTEKENIEIQGQTLTVTIISADTEYKSGCYIYDLQLQKENEVVTVAKGQFTIIQTVTR